jgi:hypothetical protein
MWVHGHSATMELNVSVLLHLADPANVTLRTTGVDSES